MADEPAGTGTINPLVDTAGRSRLVVAPGTSFADAQRAIASEGPQRHARVLHGRTRRRWSLRLDQMTGAELAALREAHAVTRGGAGATRWRSPTDGEPAEVEPVKSCPLYRIVSGGSGDIRGEAAGTRASATVELERVD